MKLPDGYRTVLNLYLEGYDHEEIAGILNVAESTTRTQYAGQAKITGIFKRGHMSNRLKNSSATTGEAFDDKEPSAMFVGRIESNLVAGPEKRSVIRPLYKWAMGATAMLVIAASVCASLL